MFDYYKGNFQGIRSWYVFKILEKYIIRVPSRRLGLGAKGCIS